MPVYFILSKNDFTGEVKKALATAVTDVHCSTTGTPSKYVTVLFLSGYRLRDEKKIMLLGNIRIGGNRTSTIIDQLRQGLIWKISNILNKPEAKVGLSFLGVYSNWVWEGGEVLPEPGLEIV